ncbi:hypothetical protein ACQ4LE_004117 [Meloidogyne hapla]|uniref:Alpha-1,3/1,6-mannosyltransferase ALG2 n=1 Tax=Meloidogyne hapla TaxID=6305 RepID=A0A1I8BV26_MELHA
MKVVFLHPDFGIGGAERLVLDSALALKKKGHKVCIITNQFSVDHCFEELKDFKGDLEVVARKMPRTIFGKFYALCAYIRICIAAFYVCLYHRDTDLIFCDQISAPLLILRLFCSGASLLFYCHYPDKLLAIKRDTYLKKLYRLVIDNIEAWTICWADKILVNSNFTNGVVQETFPALINSPLSILYPSINCEFFDNALKKFKENGTDEIEKTLSEDLVDLIKQKETITFLSVNRFERKKNIELAIQAFAFLLTKISSENSKRCVLVIAGGYDPLNSENIEHFDELVKLSEKLGVADKIKFVKSPNDISKIWLMSIARLIIYTPTGEHFGIVPVEAMFLNTPVLAVNNGGPTETIIDKKTGFLCPPEKEIFAESMEFAINETEIIKEMGIMGCQNVEKNFSFDSFSDKLNQIVCLLVSKKNLTNEDNNNKKD